MSSDTFFCDMFPLPLPIDVVWAKITLHVNLSLSLNFFCVAGIKEYKSEYRK